MTHDFNVTYLGLDISGEVYVGDGSNADPDQCDIENACFYVLDRTGLRVRADLPKELLDKICEQEWFYDAVAEKAYGSVEDAE